MGYLINKDKDQIVTAKVTLTSANLLTPGYIVDIPEYPAVKGFFWQVLSLAGNIQSGSTLYVGTSSIHVQASTASTLQYRFTGGFMQSAIDSFGFGVINTSATNPVQFVDNDKLQMHNPGTLTLGDSDLIIYITAILIRS